MAAAGLDQSLTELFLSEDRRVQVLGDLTLPSGRSIVLQPGDIAAFTVSEGVQDGLLPGACPSGCIRLTLADPEGAFLPMGKKRGASPLLGARLRLIVQVWDGTQWQSAPVGVYTLTCVSARVRGTGCVLSGMDDLGLCFDAPFALPGSPPATLGALAAAIGTQAGVAVPGDFSGSEDPVDTLPDTLAGHTLRQVLSFVCRLAGCFACCDRTGVIRIKPARNTDEAYELLPRHILRRSFDDEHLGPVRNLRIITLGGECEEDGTFLAEPETAATKTETLQIGQDPFFPYGDARNPARAAAVLEHVRGLELMALSAEWRGDPQVMLGQPVVLRDIRGHVTKTCVTRQTLRFDRGFRMEMYCDLKNEAQSASAGVLQSGFLRAGRLSGSLIVDGSLSAHALRADSITARDLSAHSIDASRVTTK